MAARLTLKAAEVAGSQDSSANTSRVAVELWVTTDNGTFNTEGSVTGALTLDGVEIADLRGKIVPPDTATLLHRGEHTVHHGPDGTKTVAVSAWITVTPYSANITASKEVELTAIPQEPWLRFGSFVLGRPATVAVRGESGRTAALRYTFGTQQGTIAEDLTGGTVVWTPPAELAGEIPNDTVGSGTFTVEVWEQGRSLGTAEYPFSASVAADVVPRVWLEAVEVRSSTVPESWNAAVALHSRIAWRVGAEGQYGASVTGCTFCCGAMRCEGLEGETDVLELYGTLAMRWVVTDSRGRRSTLRGEDLTVYPYYAPAIANASAVRCLADGTPHEGGEYVVLGGEGTCSDIAGYNSVCLSVRSRAVGGAWSDWQSTLSGAVLPGFDANTGYEVALRAADTLGGERTVVIPVPAYTVSLHLRPGGSGGAFGQFAEKDGVLQIAWDVEALGTLTVRGKTLADLIYPVGSLYMSVSSADPAALFGGTWQRIEDTFLLAAGGTYAPGATGGAASVKLTESQLPRLSGTVNFRHWGSGSPYSGVSGIISNNGEITDTANGFAATTTADGYRQLKIGFGGDAAHNNMPPYLAVYVWQRTA